MGIFLIFLALITPMRGARYSLFEQNTNKKLLGNILKKAKC